MSPVSPKTTDTETKDEESFPFDSNIAASSSTAGEPRLRRPSYPQSRPESQFQLTSYPISYTESSSSTRSSTSSFTSDTSIAESDVTPTVLLPRYTGPHHPSDFRPKSPRSSGSPANLPRRLLQTLRPRRRSSFPLIHLARRKPTQLVLTGAIVLLGLLLLSEVRTQKARRKLWDREFALKEWDVRHASTSEREINLVAYRAEYDQKRRRELIWERSMQGGQGSTLEASKDWGPAEEAALRAEIGDKWPSWWGNADVVGRSPFDHQPSPLPPGRQKRRMLFLTDYNDYLERMNTHTYEIVDAALCHPHLIVDVWGPGWAGYDRSIPLSANIRKRSHRIAQLERSKIEFDRRQRLVREAKEKQRRWQNKREWLSQALEVTRTPGPKLLEERNADVEDAEAWESPEWLEDLPVECSDASFDVVLTISNIYNEDDPHVDALDCGALLIQQLGDCHSLRCAFEWYPRANNITLSKYAFELLELFDYETVKAKYPNWEMGLFGHSPDTANEWDFYPVPWANKTSEAKIFGFDGSFYPIRTTVTDYLRDQEGDHDRNTPLLQSTTIQRHEHPGYTVSVPEVARQRPLETYELGHEYYKTHIMLREDFAKAMREAKICVFDASLERKMIRKYAQAFLSGCVVAADLPTEQEEALSRFVIPLKSSWSIEKINSAIQFYLDRPDVLQQMAMDALVYARQHLTTTNKVSHVLQMADHYREGSRGYEFPHGFSLRCRSYWSGEEGYRPPWCGQETYRGLEE